MVLSSLKGDWLNFPEEHAYENQASCYLKENAETRHCLSNVCDNKLRKCWNQKTGGCWRKSTAKVAEK